MKDLKPLRYSASDHLGKERGPQRLQILRPDESTCLKCAGYLGQQYRLLEAGEIIQAGDQYLDVDGVWLEYESFRFGSKISRHARGRRVVAKELGKN